MLRIEVSLVDISFISWIEAEKACTSALQQHRSSKGLYRRAKARRMLGRPKEAIQGKPLVLTSSAVSSFEVDLHAVLRLQPSNKEALAELTTLIPLVHKGHSNPSANSGDYANSSSSSKQPPSGADTDANTLQRLGVPKPKPIKQPSFPKTRADERKLKIMALSGSEGFGLNKNAGTNQQSGQSRHGKEKAGTKKSKTTMEIEQMRLECLSYPGWDRYVVKKAD